MILATALCLALAIAGARQSSPRAMVNGELLNAPIKNVNGSLLLPMRAVFEALRAEVRWFQAERRITAVRGDVTVQLWIDRRAAIINDREIELAVPPTLIGGSTYIPLRFPAEAFGGKVEWLGPQRLAVVTIDPLIEVAVETIKNNPLPEIPLALAGVLIVNLEDDAGNSLVLRDRQTGELSTMTVPAGTPFARNGETATFADLRPGDLVEVTRDAAGIVLRVDAAYLLVSGKVAGFAESKLLLQNGAVYQVTPQARALDDRGNEVALADLQYGREVTLRLTPGTAMVWAITLPAPTPPPDPMRIAAISALDYTGPLKQGDTLNLQVIGTPGADRVTASVGNAVTDIELTEREPGIYTRKINLGPDLPPTIASITAVMKRGEQTGEARSEREIVIDQRKPVCETLDPTPAATLFDPNPVITAALSDDGSGIDPATVRLLVNGRDVTAGAEVNEQGIRYLARGLQAGVTKLRLEFADRAGNTASFDWQVTVQAPAEARETEIYAVAHDAARLLRQGDILTIRVNATPGADLVTAAVGNAITGVRLNEREPGRYVGEVTIGPDIVVNDAPVYASLREGNTVREAQSVQRVTIDTRPPQYTLYIPEAEETYSREYALGASFGDDDSGIDPRAVRLLLNGRDVTVWAAISDRDLRYNAVDLPIGVSTFRLELTDRAGNVTAREWQVVVLDKPPLILAVNHDAADMLKLGDELNIRVIGTPGADRAWARIGNAVTDIRLIEREPGRYSQRVTINEKVYAADIYVYAVLRRNGLDSEEVRAERRVTLDSEPPDCLTVTPKRDSIVYAPDTVIEATYRDGGTGIVPGRVKLLVNGLDVTAQATVSNSKVRYEARGLPIGAVKIELALEDRIGNVTRVEWPFNFQIPPAILEITHNADKTRNPGEALKIVARLSVKPAKLEWLFDDRVLGESITGDAAGVYTFLYTIKPADAAGKHKIGLRCTDNNGQTETVYAAALLSIAELKAKDLAITSPADKAKAPDSITITGVAAPNAGVRITVAGSSNVPLRPRETQVAQVVIKSDADGLWTTRPIALPKDRALQLFTVTAELLDANGNAVKKVSIRLKR